MEVYDEGEQWVGDPRDSGEAGVPWLACYIAMGPNQVLFCPSVLSINVRMHQIRATHRSQCDANPRGPLEREQSLLWSFEEE